MPLPCAPSSLPAHRWLSGTYPLIHPMAIHLGGGCLKLKALLELQPSAPLPAQLPEGATWQVAPEYGELWPQMPHKQGEPPAVVCSTQQTCATPQQAECSNPAQASMRPHVSTITDPGAAVAILPEAARSAAPAAVQPQGVVPGERTSSAPALQQPASSGHSALAVPESSSPARLRAECADVRLCVERAVNLQLPRAEAGAQPLALNAAGGGGMGVFAYTAPCIHDAHTCHAAFAGAALAVYLSFTWPERGLLLATPLVVAQAGHGDCTWSATWLWVAHLPLRIAQPSNRAAQHELEVQVGGFLRQVACRCALLALQGDGSQQSTADHAQVAPTPLFSSPQRIPHTCAGVGPGHERCCCGCAATALRGGARRACGGRHSAGQRTVRPIDAAVAGVSRRLLQCAASRMPAAA